jgi:hypothetical protein
VPEAVQTNGVVEVRVTGSPKLDVGLAVIDPVSNLVAEIVGKVMV